jgi:hypothetical protein
MNKDILNIKTKDGKIEYGANQNWYKSEWQRKSGCGPSSAANLFAYISSQNPKAKDLCDLRPPYEQASFLEHMENLWSCVTPTAKGTNSTSLFIEGSKKYAASRGVEINGHSLNVRSRLDCKRPTAEEFIDFIREGLENNCPVAFLNLSNGRVDNLYNWHWVTLVELWEDENGTVYATASDEGVKRDFDIRLWVETTLLGGGLVYFTIE